MKLTKFVGFLALLGWMTGCHSSPSSADRLAELHAKGIPFTEEEFIRRFDIHDDQTVLWMLEAGMKPDAQEGAAMRIGIQKNYYLMVNDLLRFGFRADQTFSGDFIPIIQAAAYGRTRMVRRMLDLQPNLNTRDFLGRTALMMAAKSGNMYVVEDLLNARAHVHQLDLQGRSALTYAVVRNNTASAKVLLDAGANPNVGNKKTTPPLLTAAYLGNQHIVQILLRAHADPNSANATGYTALMAATRTRSADIVTQLLKAGADPNRRNHGGFRGESALWIAASQHDKALTQLLLQHGANRHIQDHQGQTPDSLVHVLGL